MRTLLLCEVGFSALLVIGSMATLDRPLTSLRAWAMAMGSGMFLWFIGVQAVINDPFWTPYLALTLGVHSIGLILVIQDRAAKKRHVELGAIADETRRNSVSTLSHLLRNLDGGGAAGDGAEVARQAELLTAQARGVGAIKR